MGKAVLSACSYLLLYLQFSDAISLFLRNAHLCDSQLHLCSVITLLFKRWGGMEHVGERKISKVKQTQAGFGQNVLLQDFQAKKAKKKCLALLCYVHSHGKPRSVLRGIS